MTTFSSAARLPAHATALGRALLAFGPASTIELAILQGLRPFTTHTVTAPDRFRRALAVTRLARVAVTRRELEPNTCGVAMPIFGPGGEVVAAVELAVGDLGHELQQLTTTLSIATRSLSRELASAARLGRPCPIPHPRLAMGPTVEQATALVTEALG